MAITRIPGNTPTPSALEKGVSNRTQSRWQYGYARCLLITDIAIVALTVFAAQIIRYGLDGSVLTVAGEAQFGFSVDYTWFSLVLIGAWLAVLSLTGTRDYRITGTGTAEYRAVALATFQTFGALAILAYLFKTQIGRGYLLLALPIGLVALLLSRWMWRQWLLRQRRAGLYVHRAVIIGEYQKNMHVIKQILGEPNAGYEVVAAISDFDDQTTADIAAEAYPFPWINTSKELLHTIDQLAPDTVIYTSSDTFNPERLRRLGWRMEERGVDFVVAPALTDIAGQRIHTRPVAGLPLIHVEYPELTGTKYWSKRIFDIAGSLALIVVGSPVLLAVALAVKVSSPGPVLYRQERVGTDGVPFKMLKFRSMIPNADAQLKELLEAQGTAEKPLFKIENDPRITPIGRFIRKYSLDELPQFFNVLKGDMSLVGPRPQVAAEVALYDEWAARRLKVKPGITGLWQVSGRSDIEWEDAIRLDLYYVENWSLMGDLQLLYRTVKTVMFPAGAY